MRVLGWGEGKDGARWRGSRRGQARLCMPEQRDLYTARARSLVRASYSLFAILLSGRSPRIQTFIRITALVQVDWLGAKAQIDAAKEAGVEHFIIVGSMVCEALEGMGVGCTSSMRHMEGMRCMGHMGRSITWHSCFFPQLCCVQISSAPVG